MDDRNQTWHYPGHACRLNPPASEVHVWRANLCSSTEDLSRRCGLLSSEEQQRADRFRSEHDRARFVLGRIVARSVLGHCLQKPAAEVSLTLDNLGKPVVAAPETSIHFNIAHSGDHVLFALARERRVGVDVEQIRETNDLNKIAAVYFSNMEYLRLGAVPESIRTESFCRCWIMKEAYLKARGEGLRLPLDSFDVAFLSDEMPRLLETRFDYADAGRWCFHILDLGSAYLAALATEVAPTFELKLWDWNSWQAKM